MWQGGMIQDREGKTGFRTWRSGVVEGSHSLKVQQTVSGVSPFGSDGFENRQ